jgi:hypothetical protein
VLISFFAKHSVVNNPIIISLFYINSGAALSARVFYLDDEWSRVLELLFRRIAYRE